MRFFPYNLAVFIFIFAACNSNSSSENNTLTYDSTPPSALTESVYDSSMFNHTMDSIATAERKKTFQNAAFRNITVSQTAPAQFKIAGQARVFEGSFSWVIEDGMDELKEGHEQVGEGAPARSSFSMTVDAKKDEENSVLHLILFEQSAKDGRRINELPLFLY